ncbi:unnamed protein product [Arctia plantaginis]|uniref:Uncharacterized protein n=1 Tax=Arctia plantaginis TaxID=874455 RepID=A0A8S1ATU5_ARCPL|nr:unnamed protein product [Arctia plantaginis]
MASNINTSSNNGRKMSALVSCFRCGKSVDIKSTAKCSICKNRFERNCDGITEQTFRFINQDSNKNWKCKTCIEKNLSIRKKSSTGDLSYITQRKKNNTIIEPILSTPETTQLINKDQCINTIQIATEETSIITDSQLFTDSETSYEMYDTPNKMSKSMDCTVTDQLCISEMKEQISMLTSKLESTESEMENIILENNNLNRQIQILNEEIKLLKSLCSSSTIVGNSPYKSDKKKRNSLLRRKMSPTVSPLASTSNLEARNDIETSSQRQKIKHLEQQLEDIQQKNMSLAKQIESLTRSELKNNKSLPIERERLHTDNITLASGRIFN